MIGELGAGKTCLVQGIATGLNVKEYAFSPSFVIVREYCGRLSLYHVDFYRLAHLSEIADLGLEEHFQGDGICVVEWADKGLEIVPRDNLLITLQYVSISETQRAICLEPHGERYCELVEQLKMRLKSQVLNINAKQYQNPANEARGFGI